MRLGTKHQNQFQVVRSDFSGGLNTSVSSDGIAENQLSIANNVEVDHSTGKLKTVSGTIDLRQFENIFAAMYDDINKKLLVVNENKEVFTFDLETKAVAGSFGTLNGSLYPISTNWEDGLLIASGGKLQYFNGKELLTISTSPTSTSVYVRAGRVLVTDETNVYYSSVGDEESWSSDSDDASSGIFVGAGYKDGGKLIAMVNLVSDVLLVKDNRRVYRLSGEYPDWQMSEVSRNIEVSGRRSICSLADSVFILGRSELQRIQPTNFYGDMKPEDVATLVTKEVQNLPKDSLLRYLPSLQQIWAINGTTALIFDLITNSWYKRKFNSPVVDVISIGGDILVVKSDRVSKLAEGSFYDSGESLRWHWQGRRLISHYDYFLKHTTVSFSPVNASIYQGRIFAGAVVVDLPDYKREVLNGRRRFAFSRGEPIFKNYEPIYDNPEPIYTRTTIIAENRNVYRSKFLDIGGRGSAGGIIFNSVTLDLVEV